MKFHIFLIFFLKYSLIFKIILYLRPNSTSILHILYLANDYTYMYDN
jgi:hypothetical protein